MVDDGDWTIMSVNDSCVEISTDSGDFYRLGNDHIRSFATDAHRSIDGLKHAFLQLHVQLYIGGSTVTAVPNPQPGVPVPPVPNRELKARAVFIPELERVSRRMVQILDRVVVNYSATARAIVEKPSSTPTGETWESLKPVSPRLFPDAAPYHDLKASDAQLLSEFYGAVSEVDDLVEHWSGNMALTDYNAWNVLMHKVQHGLRLAAIAVQKLCPERAFDATVPTGGTLLSQFQRVLNAADRARQTFTTNFEEFMRKKAGQGRSVAPLKRPG